MISWPRADYAIVNEISPALNCSSLRILIFTEAPLQPMGASCACLRLNASASGVYTLSLAFPPEVILISQAINISVAVESSEQPPLSMSVKLYNSGELRLVSMQPALVPQPPTVRGSSRGLQPQLSLTFQNFPMVPTHAALKAFILTASAVLQADVAVASSTMTQTGLRVFLPLINQPLASAKLSFTLGNTTVTTMELPFAAVCNFDLVCAAVGGGSALVADLHRFA